MSSLYLATSAGLKQTCFKSAARLFLGRCEKICSSFFILLLDIIVRKQYINCMTLANKFTFSRVLLAPLFFVVYFSPAWFGLSSVVSVFIMLPLFAFMEFTDFLDGYFARKMKEVSDFGKIFDPFGDVLLHMTIFFCLALSGYMPPFILILIFYREFSMLFLRLVAIKEGVAVGARKGGKAKTVLYVVVCSLSLLVESCVRCGICFSESISVILEIVLISLYVIALAACYVSFVDYLIHFKNVLKKHF